MTVGLQYSCIICEKIKPDGSFVASRECAHYTMNILWCFTHLHVEFLSSDDILKNVDGPHWPPYIDKIHTCLEQLDELDSFFGELYLLIWLTFYIFWNIMDSFWICNIFLNIQYHLNWKDFLMIFERSLLCSQSLHLFDHKYSINSNIVQHYYILK